MPATTHDSRFPGHVSIIMDGNGRWATLHGKPRVQGHVKGVDSVRECTSKAAQMGVEYLSIFAFSEENWGRSKEEVQALMKLFIKCMDNELPLFMQNNIKFRVVGNYEHLPSDVIEGISAMEAKTADNTGMTLIVLLSYSGKWDITQAARSLARDVAKGVLAPEEIDESALSGRLALAEFPDPDLIIRTSGEKRISNYLLWQGAYSEFLFVDKLWPDFSKDDFAAAIDEYSHRDRRYGKIKRDDK